MTEHRRRCLYPRLYRSGWQAGMYGALDYLGRVSLQISRKQSDCA